MALAPVINTLLVYLKGDYDLIRPAHGGAGGAFHAVDAARQDLALANEGAFSVCLSGGSTPRPLYRLLADPPYRERFHWFRTHCFWGDERFVAHDDALSNYRNGNETLLAKPEARITLTYRRSIAAGRRRFSLSEARSGRSWSGFGAAIKASRRLMSARAARCSSSPTRRPQDLRTMLLSDNNGRDFFPARAMMMALFRR
jgi:hypothetical protein